MSREVLFALYRGDEFVDLGTKKELAARLGVKPEYIGYMASPAHMRRSNWSQNRLMAYRIEEDEEMQDDWDARTAAFFYEQRIKELERLARSMWRYMDALCLRGAPVTRVDVEQWKTALSIDHGIEVI